MSVCPPIYLYIDPFIRIFRLFIMKLVHKLQTYKANPRESSDRLVDW